MKPYTPEILPLRDLNYYPLIRLIATANAAVARYDGFLQNIPNPQVLLTPLITQEAVLSSKIEGTQATLEDVMEYEAWKSEILHNDDISEIINYRSAMNFAVERLADLPLSLRLLREVHTILLDSVRGANKSKGDFRKIQNWIGTPGSTVETASHVPPEITVMAEALDNLEKYFHYEENDLLVQIAVIHAQFELIHPFLDGNGRLGRMLIPLFLYEKGLLSSPMFYMSAYFERNRLEYYQKLRLISQEDDWDSWIKFFLQAVVEQADTNLKKAKEIMALYEAKKDRIAEVTRSQYSIKILDALFIKPIFSSREFAELTGIPEKAVYKYLKVLKENSIIESNDRERYQTFFFVKLLNIVSS